MAWNLSLPRIPRATVFRVICFAASVAAGAWFCFALDSALRSHDAADIKCAVGPGVVDENLSYLEITLLDQHPIERIFNGTVFVNLGSKSGKDPVHLRLIESGNGLYAPNFVDMDLLYDPLAQTLWPKGRPEMNLNRVSGAHRDFPFDSAKFDFDLSWDPAVPLNNFWIRNRNPSFDLACSTVKAPQVSSGKVHISFEVERNPLVQLTAVVLVGAAFLFVIGIAFFVRTDSLPTAVASFFFSLWSIRGILSSEMKTFPTMLDLAILSLCVLLLVALGIRLAVKEMGPRRSPETKD
jgi:hypothetical protein